MRVFFCLSGGHDIGRSAARPPNVLVYILISAEIPYRYATSSQSAMPVSFVLQLTQSQDTHNLKHSLAMALHYRFEEVPIPKQYKY
jgi:hypothetical protein